MASKDFKITAAELNVLAENKPFADKLAEIVDLTDEEMVLITGGWGGYGFGGYGFGCGCGFGGYGFGFGGYGFGGYGFGGYGFNNNNRRHHRGHRGHHHR